MMRGAPLAAWSLACCLMVAGELAAQTPAGELPWRTGQKASQPRLLTPRDYFFNKGIEESHWHALLDGRPQVADENETLTRLLYAMPQPEVATWERWCAAKLDPAALAAAPADHRGEGFTISGRAKQVEVVEILKELVPLYDFQKYYRVTVETSDPAIPIVVNTRQIPALWKEAATLDEPVRVMGLFLKAGEEADGKTPLYFVAPRLAWFPDTPNKAFGVKEDHVWLAARGMDLALWDDVRAHNGGGIGAEEAECFYQLLAKLQAKKRPATQPPAAAPFDLPGMLTRPNDLLGQTFVCTGLARSVKKVSVPERFRERLGLSHYYEIDLFVQNDVPIRLTGGKGKETEELPTFADGFPTTFCVTQLPEGLEVGVDVRYRVRLTGVFYKLWAFHSDYMKQFEQERQPAPLLMGFKTDVIANEESVDFSMWGSTLVMVILASVLTIWYSAWRASRGDKKFQRDVLSKYGHGSGEKKPSVFQMPRRDEPPGDAPLVADDTGPDVK